MCAEVVACCTRATLSAMGAPARIPRFTLLCCQPPAVAEPGCGHGSWQPESAPKWAEHGRPVCGARALVAGESAAK